jgi:hypothetical protein
MIYEDDTIKLTYYKSNFEKINNTYYLTEKK